jgi:uncharacterized protein involved in exopolysaccharide biosynthesis
MVPTSGFLNRHWRIMAVATIGALLAFAGSFLVEPTYSSSTRLLIHSRDATLLTSTGQDLSAQPGVIDSTLAQSLASTYAGIATSRAVAVSVVDTLGLADRPKKTGPIAAVEGALAWVYRCGKAVITSGFCAAVDPHEKAVLAVQKGIAVSPLGTNAGSTAGTTGSYVLEVQASGTTAVEAKKVTDAVADALVRSSSTRFAADSAKNVATLKGLVADAQTEVDARGKALAEFQTENGISAADSQQHLSAATNESIRSDLIKAQASQADLKAQLAAVARALKSTPKNQSSSQSIVTGRSTTELNGTSTNSVYNDLLVQQSTLQAQLDGQTARVTQLQATLSGSTVLADNAAQAKLSSLQNSLQVAESNLSSLTDKLQSAQVTAAQAPADLTRIDQAGQPTYPSAPKRYIYLLLGLVIGALAGLGLTAQARKRDVGSAMPVSGYGAGDLGHAPALEPSDDLVRTQVLTGPSNGRLNGSAHGQPARRPGRADAEAADDDR